MAERRIDSGLVFSAAAHAAVLLWTAVSFAAKPLDAPPTESMPIDIISDVQFSQMMAGTKTAPKNDAPKPFVEKKDAPKPAEDVTAKVADKEIVTASTAAAAEPAPPPPEKKIPEPKPKPVEAKVEPKPEPKPELKKAEPEQKKPDAEALKKDEKKPPPKKEEAKVVPPTPPKKPEPKPDPKPPVAEHKPTPKPPKKIDTKPQVAEQKSDEPKFDVTRIAALLDKRQPQRLASAGDIVNTAPTLGTRTGQSMTLSQNEIDALRARIQQCWNPPAGVAEAKDLVVQVRILFNQDGSLSGEPRVVGRMTGTQQVAAESAMRAIRRCAPYSFMPAAKYDSWKDVEVTFDPRDLYRG